MPQPVAEASSQLPSLSEKVAPGFDFEWEAICLCIKYTERFGNLKVRMSTLRMPVRDRDGASIVRALTAIAVALAIISVALAIAWKHEHEMARCWRAMAEDDYAPECLRR